MALLHESRLDNSVNGGSLGIGEHVDVRTKLGAHVTSGTVTGSTPFGVILKESEFVSNFYSEKLYVFSVHEPEAEVRASNMIADIALDDRVKMKLKAMSEAGAPQPSGAKGSATPVQNGEQPANGVDAEVSKEVEDAPVANTDGAIDVDALPDDIKAAIIDTNQMDELQLNKVMSEISDAAMKGLKRAGIKEQKIFGTVQQIQDAVYKILTGKSKDSKKNGKK